MSNTTKTANELIPAISLRGLVVFPAMVLHFDIGRERSVNAVKAAAEGNGRIFLVAQKDAAQTEPELSDIYEVGVIAEVRQLLTTPDGLHKSACGGSHTRKARKERSRQGVPPV